MMIWLSIDAKPPLPLGALATWWNEHSFETFLAVAIAVATLFAAWPGVFIALVDRFALLLERTHERRN